MSVSHAVTDVVTNQSGQVDLGQVTALAAVFTQVSDPRKPKGIRHPLAAVLTVLTMALLCGARDFRQAADRITELPQASSKPQAPADTRSWASGSRQGVTPEAGGPRPSTPRSWTG